MFEPLKYWTLLPHCAIRSFMGISSIARWVADEVSRDGFAIVADVFRADEIDALVAAIESNIAKESPSGRGGVRNLLDRVPQVRQLANVPALRDLIEQILGAGAFVVRGILFDKTAETNWKVPWHQDLTIAVLERADIAGFGPWTMKDGVHHVQPPVEILESMLAVRIHLDECGPENGPIRVIRGSHSHGRLSAEQIQTMQQTSPGVSCAVGRGGILVMRPLLLRASSAAMSPSHRRVIHLEFAASELPAGLCWYSGSRGNRPNARSRNDSKYRARKIRTALRKVLMEHWDPIGVSGEPEASGEYDGYVGGVYGLLAAHATDEAIARHLRKIEVESMGMSALDECRLPSVVRALRSAFGAIGNERRESVVTSPRWRR